MSAEVARFQTRSATARRAARSTAHAPRRLRRSFRTRVAAAFQALCHGAEASVAYERTRRWWRDNLA
jgi:hypothetical protein